MRRQVLALCGYLLVSVAGAGCALVKGGSSEKAALDEVVVAWEKGFNSHDAKALAKLYTEDADGRYGREDIVEGRDAIEKKRAEVLVKDSEVETKLKVLQRRFLAPDIVLEDGRVGRVGSRREERAEERCVVIHPGQGRREMAIRL